MDVHGQVWRAVRSRWKESAVGFSLPVNSGPFPKKCGPLGSVGGCERTPCTPLATGLELMLCLLIRKLQLKYQVQTDQELMLYYHLHLSDQERRKKCYE